ncbi:pentatricopeptide repeat-containing protein At1g62680, mitochondrial-like [Chenopodium quinoa]|uniref:pentatricopeptide repeat-containing protein At1g62680, mitochondrial-like n=1 Tax=Chenopodium quinoa TaxID=63459 RepID=UPI000B76CF19|nr:pentatricopeptide repeat-containing protein At1g62680, mitochondrial-like [Chenopodium quinoa]
MGKTNLILGLKSLKKGKFSFFLSYPEISTFQFHFRNFDKTHFLYKISANGFHSNSIISNSESSVASFECFINIFDKLINDRPLPPIATFTSILKSILKVRHYSAAIPLFKKLCLLHDQILPDLCALNMNIECYCRLNQVDLGFSLLGKIIKLGYEPDIVTFTNLIHGLCAIKNSVDAVKLFHRVIDLGLQLDLYTYGALIKCLFKTGRNADALKLLRMRRLMGCKPDIGIYHMIMYGFCKDNLLSQASELFSEMISDGVLPTVTTYNLLIWGHGKLGQ